MTDIHRSEVADADRWVNSTGLPPDGREHFRERKAYGNRHAVFEVGAEWGTVHVDEHNATDFPAGTVNHGAKWMNEQTGVPEGLAKLAIILLGAYGVYRAGKWVSKNL